MCTDQNPHYLIIPQVPHFAVIQKLRFACQPGCTEGQAQSVAGNAVMLATQGQAATPSKRAADVGLGSWLAEKGSIGSVVYLLIAETGQFCDERIDQPAPRREEAWRTRRDAPIQPTAVGPVLVVCKRYLAGKAFHRSKEVSTPFKTPRSFRNCPDEPLLSR